VKGNCEGGRFKWVQKILKAGVISRNWDQEKVEKELVKIVQGTGEK